MEILASNEVTTMSWWAVFAIIAMGVGAVGGFYCACENMRTGALILLTVALIGVIVLIVAPISMPSGKMSYTVEITDNTMFQSLIQKGYTFERLFDNKEIYKIIGDVLK